MLSDLRIRNFALIDQLTVQLGPGLNVLTGETGAGKSIVVGAISLLLGERASSEVVRTGEERAVVEGVFEVGASEEVVRWLDEHGIEADEGLVILKREVALEGRNRAWINGSPTTASLLGELGGLLVNLHGQHEHQTLLRREEQLAILDAFAGVEALTAEVARAHAALGDISSEIRSLEQRRRDALQRADFLRFQAEEIEAAGVEVGEEERLQEEFQRLSHAEELIALAGSVVEQIGEGGESASTRLGAARRSLDQLVRIDASQAEMSELFDTAYYALEELASRLDAYLLVVEHDPVRLEEIRSRQDLLYRLRSKYGPTLTEVVEAMQAAKKELALIDEAEWERSELRRREDAARKVLVDLAETLTTRRAAAAAALSGEVTVILPEIGMEGGVFETILIPLGEPGTTGAEEAEFRVSLNRGFAPRPLAQVASGGELSRVMLALKTILARLDFVPTLIFDEVDAGIGGRVALRVGEKLRQVALEHQVLAITHLPQIAARAHRHLFVRKDEVEGRTTTAVATLESDDRVREIARMLGGDPESDASLIHARELLHKGGGIAAVA